VTALADALDSGQLDQNEFTAALDQRRVNGCR
jgi:hypothetical protein